MRRRSRVRNRCTRRTSAGSISTQAATMETATAIARGNGDGHGNREMPAMAAAVAECAVAECAECAVAECEASGEDQAAVVVAPVPAIRRVAPTASGQHQAAIPRKAVTFVPPITKGGGFHLTLLPTTFRTARRAASQQAAVGPVGLGRHYRRGGRHRHDGNRPRLESDPAKNHRQHGSKHPDDHVGGGGQRRRQFRRRQRHDLDARRLRRNLATMPRRRRRGPKRPCPRPNRLRTSQLGSQSDQRHHAVVPGDSGLGGHGRKATYSPIATSATATKCASSARRSARNCSTTNLPSARKSASTTSRSGSSAC